MVSFDYCKAMPFVTTLTVIYPRSHNICITPGLRYNRIKNTSNKIKHIQMPCLVQTDALFDRDRGLSL